MKNKKIFIPFPVDTENPRLNIVPKVQKYVFRGNDKEMKIRGNPLIRVSRIFLDHSLQELL